MWIRNQEVTPERSRRQRGVKGSGDRGILEGWGGRWRGTEKRREERSGLGVGSQSPAALVFRNIWEPGLPVGRRGRLEVLEGQGPTERRGAEREGPGGWEGVSQRPPWGWGLQLV